MSEVPLYCRVLRQSVLMSARHGAPGAGFWVLGLGFRVQGLGFRASGLGFGFRVSGSGFRVGLGF